MECPECCGKAHETETYKDIQIYTCEDCQNRFGFIETEEERLREVA